MARALGDAILQEVGKATVASAQERQRVRLVVVSRQDDDPGIGVHGSDGVSAVDPLELERRGHLDVGDDDVGEVFLRGLQQCGRVGRHADHIDVIVGVE